jgi:hypothetical protein
MLIPVRYKDKIIGNAESNTKCTGEIPYLVNGTLSFSDSDLARMPQELLSELHSLKSPKISVENAPSGWIFVIEG